jgi:hypothetical protein
MLVINKNYTAMHGQGNIKKQGVSFQRGPAYFEHGGALLS